MSRVVHFEILGEDPEKLVAFYRDVFGWKVQSWNGPHAYWLVDTGEAGAPGINGGIMHRHFPQPVVHTIQLDDRVTLEASIASTESAGGALEHGPNDIPGVGRVAYCADPEGILFGILEPAKREG